MAELEAWAREFAAAQREPAAAGAFADWTLERIVGGVPEVDDDLVPLISEAVREHWAAFLDWFFSSDPFELVPAARRLPAELARRHLGLPVLLAVYRRAQDAAWEYAIGVVREAPGDVDHEALLIWLWSRAGDWFSASVDQSVVLHQEEALRIQQHGDAQRHEAVVRVLEGRAEDPSALSAVLDGYPVAGTHLAFIARALTADAIPQLEPALTRVASAASPGRLAVVRPGGRELWGWLPVSRPGPLDRAEPLEGAGVDPLAVRVTVGGPASGIDGFVEAFGDARSALTVALAPGRQAPVTAYADVAPLTLLAADPRAAGRFARRTLRGLADPSAGKLRDTVRAVLCADGGAETVAASLRVHKNTVRYRVGQAERLLGAPLRCRARDLLLALDYYEAFLAPSDSATEA